MPTPTRLKLEVEEGDFTFDFTSMKMRDYREFIEANKEADIGGAYLFLAKCTVQWPFDGDPSDPDAYDDLSLDEYKQVLNAAVEAAGKQIAGN